MESRRRKARTNDREVVVEASNTGFASVRVRNLHVDRLIEERLRIRLDSAERSQHLPTY